MLGETNNNLIDGSILKNYEGVEIEINKLYESDQIVLDTVKSRVVNILDLHINEKGSIVSLIERNIKKINLKTTGIIAFFKYLFFPGTKKNLKELKTLLEGFITEIKDYVPNKTNKTETVAKSVLTQKTTTTESKEKIKTKKLSNQTDLINIPEVKPQVIKDIRANKQEIISEDTPSNLFKEKIQTASNEFDKPNTSPSNIHPFPDNQPLGSDGPPPLPDHLPPFPGAMPLNAQSQTISVEEKHKLAEEKRLLNLQKERANYNNFYILSPPKNARELEERKEELKTDINKLKFLGGNVNIHESLLKDINEMIASKQSKLNKTEQDLLPTKAPITIRSNAQLFKEKINKFTNDELKILVCFAFDAQVPETKHPLYNLYQQNQVLLNNIFKEYEQLIKHDTGKAFLGNQDGWKEYFTNTSIFNFLDTLNNRAGISNRKNALVEPKYEIKIYEKKKIFKSPVKKLENKNLVEEMQEKFNKIKKIY